MDDLIKTSGIPKSAKDNRGNAALYPHAIIGIVKNNVDPTHSGKISVFLKRLNSSVPDNPAHWNKVSYLSPFFGYTPNTGSPDNNGDYVNNPNSYGFWAPVPDLNAEVVCIFINGDPNFGFYIGTIPQPGINFMVPAIGSSDSIIPNAGEASSYGGATKLPVAEINNANPANNDNASLAFQPRPVHSYQAAILNKQGLIRDPDRGTIGSSSERESPSRVFGWSTPGRPIYQGGYTDDNIKAAIAANDPDENFKVIGRLGGHTFVMDDGDILGTDQLVRLRTATGHMIMMNDKAGTLFIIHANGQTYIELGKEGTIDMFASNSVNIRTKGDLNLHADRDVNIHAGRDFKVHADNNINTESIKDNTNLVGGNFSEYVQGNASVLCDVKYSVKAGDDIGITSGGTIYETGGPNIKMNSGTSSLVPDKVKQIPINAQTDTLYDSKTGYSSAPGFLASITSRAPAHSPWTDANKGVDVKNNDSADANFPPAPSDSLSAVNGAAAATPANVTSPSLTSTVPSIPAASPLDATTTNSLVSQMAVNAATGLTAGAVATGAGIVAGAGGSLTAAIGPLGLNPTQLSAAGILKPGVDAIINKNIQSGMGLRQAMPPNLFTGAGPGSLDALLSLPVASAGAAGSLLSSGLNAIKGSGLISGAESSSQLGGLALSSASAGLGPTLDLAKNALPSASGLASSLGALTSGLPANPLAGAASSLMAAGKFASGLANKALNPIGAVDVTGSLKGAAEGAFSSITAGFKKLTAGVPVTLPGTNSALPIPGGLSALSNLTTPNLPSLPTSIAGLSSAISSAGGGSGIASAISSAGGLASLASASLPSIPSLPSVPGLPSLPGLPGLPKLPSLSSLPDAASLNSAITSLGTGGNPTVQMPTVASGTVNYDSLVAQSKSLLGNPKIPPLNFG